jgi:predicted transposase YdaD
MNFRSFSPSNQNLEQALRKMELIVKTEVEAMTIHYDIETDGLYLQGKEEGIERGIEKGIEKGIELEKQQLVHKLWIFQETSLEKMAFLVDLSPERVTEIILAHLQSKGMSEMEATKTIAAYQAQFESK